MSSPTSKVMNVPLADRYNGDKIVGEDVNEFSYSRIPVSSFGKNMLESMGWYEGRGLGLNPENALHQPVEFLPRHHRLGLGADPMPATLQRKKDGTIVAAKPAQIEANLKKNMVAANGSDKVRSYVGLGEKLVERKSRVGKLEKNARVKISRGRHSGLKGLIVAVNEVNEECYIQLDINQINVKVPNDQLEIIYSSDEENDHEAGGKGKAASETSDDAGSQKKKRKRKKEKKLHNDKESDNDDDDAVSEKANGNEKKKSKKDKKNKNKNKKESKKSKLKWVLPGVRVRVVSKNFENGKFYNMKLTVTDILDKRTFQAVTQNGELIDNLTEKDIQTVLPPVNGNVILLGKEFKGKTGILKQRDKDNDKLTVLLLQSFELITCSADEAAEFIAS